MGMNYVGIMVVSQNKGTPITIIPTSGALKRVPLILGNSLTGTPKRKVELPDCNLSGDRLPTGTSWVISQNPPYTIPGSGFRV